MMLRSRGGSDFAPLGLQSGLGLATFASFVSLLSILPLAMNQFAIDRAGLTLMLLAPLDTGAAQREGDRQRRHRGDSRRRLLHRRRAAVPGGHPALWLCIPLTVVAAYLTAAPVAAILSAVFPRAVDLNSIGRAATRTARRGCSACWRSWPRLRPAAADHLVGVGLQRPLLAPCRAGVDDRSLGISLVLFRLAADIFERRRENLGLTSQRS